MNTSPLKSNNVKAGVEYRLYSPRYQPIRCNRDNFYLPPRSNWLRVAAGEDVQYNNDSLLCGYYREPFSLVVHGNQSELTLQYTDIYSYSDGFSAWYLGLDEPLIGIKQIMQSIYVFFR